MYLKCLRFLVYTLLQLTTLDCSRNCIELRLLIATFYAGLSIIVFPSNVDNNIILKLFYKYDVLYCEPVFKSSYYYKFIQACISFNLH